MRLILLPLTLLSAILLSACSGSDAGEDSGGGVGALKVVATTTQIGDFAREVGGERIDLTVLLSPNQDAHDFELEPSQIRAVSEADLILRNGLGLDAFLDKALEGSDAAVATLSDGVTTPEGGHAHEAGDDAGDEHAHDPHIWFSVENARHMVEGLRDALVAQDAANAGFYRDNAAAYLETLSDLDEDIRVQVQAVPEPCRKLVTNHDVLGYYASAYGFQIVGSVIPSTTSDAQASAADVAQAVRSIQEQGVPAVFAEASINPDLIQQVGREAGVVVVDDLYGDSLGPEGSDGATYVDMMRSNTEKITGALKDCRAPAARS